MSRRPVLAVLVAALLGAAVVVPSHAASAAAVPADHVKECAAQGLHGTSEMTLVSSQVGQDRSGTHASRARVWLYAVPGGDERCVVAEATGARVARRAGAETTYSVGHQLLQSGVAVVDSGETLPFSDEVVRTGGATGRTALLADEGRFVEVETVPADAADSLPPGLAGLAGHEVTLTTAELTVRFYPSAWTSVRLARPMSAARARTRQAAEVAAARKVLEARLAAAAAERDATLAQALTATGLTAAWLTFFAAEHFETSTGTARAVFAASRRMAREHARQARRGVDIHQDYAHEITLVVPMR